MNFLNYRINDVNEIYPEDREKDLLYSRMKNESVLFKGSDNINRKIDKVGYFIPIKKLFENNVHVDITSTDFLHFGEKVFLVYEYGTYYTGYFSNTSSYCNMVYNSDKKDSCFTKYYGNKLLYFLKEEIFFR